ncbi:MAG: hypothetical protein PHS42_05920 [Sulfurimonas sp.]|nr:hypothetical protein [Sulfurimonas sp.]
MKFEITIIIPVLHPESNFFTKTVPLLNRLNAKCRVVLISSSGELIEGEYETIVIDKKEFNHANTRNMALLHVSDFYLFMTQDATPFDEYLIENLLNAFSDEDVVVSYARQIPYEGAHISERFARERNYPNVSIVKSRDDIKTLGIKTFFSSDSCAMYRGDYFRRVGGFKKDLNTSEDMEFAARAILDNKKIAYSAEARVYHSHVYGVSDLFKRYLAIGKFFKENAWVQESIKESASTEKTGAKQAFEELRYVAAREPSALLKSFLFIVVKYVGYSLGRR